MICNVKSQKQRKLRRLIARDIMDTIEHKQPFDLKSYTQSIYNVVKEQTNDHGMAVDYARLTPFFIDQIISSDTELLRGLVQNGLDRNDLTDLILSIDDPTAGVEALETYLGLQDNITNELKELNQDKEESEAPPVTEEVPQVEEAQAPVERLQQEPVEVRDETVATGRTDFKASPPTMQADVSFESTPALPYQVPDPEQEFYFNVKRKIVKMLGDAGVDYDSRNLSLPGYGPVYLTAMPATAIPEEYLRPGLDLTQPEVKEAHEQGVVLALTTSDGALIHFDENGDAGDMFSDTTKPAYYFLRRVSDFKNEEEQARFDKYQKRVIKSLAEKLKTGNKPSTEDYAAATQIVERETKLIDDIRKFINEDKTRQIRTAITGGTLGYTKFDYIQINNPLNQVNFDGEIFDPKLPTEKEIEQGLNSGAYYFKLESMYGRPIEIERAYIKDSGMKETIISLLTDSLVKEDSQGRQNEVDYQERRDLIKPYLNTSRSTIQILPDEMGGHKLRLLGTEFTLRTEAEREKMKGILDRYFSNLAPTRKVSSPGNRKIVKAGDTANYKLGAVVEVPVEGGKPNYYVIEYAKHNIDGSAINADNFESVDEVIPQDNGTTLIKTSNKSYKQDYIKEHFSMHYELNAEKKLVRLDAYFTFAPLEEDLNQIYNLEEEIEKEVEEVQDITPEETSLTDESTSDLSADDLLQQNWDDEELQKSLQVKGGELKATKKQIADAKTWYENSPLAKHIPFQVMFNAINTKNPGAAATWSQNGIILYKGADYSDLYHEAWHGFTQTFLTKEQKTSLYNEVKKKSGSFTNYSGRRVSFAKASNLEIEEYLAEDFRKYMLKGQRSKKNSPKRNNIFRKIYNLLKALFNNMTVTEVTADDRANKTINDLYEKLRVGNLAEYSFSQNNASFGNLNTGIQPFGKSFDEPLLYEDSMLVVNTIDSLISEFIDRSNAGLTDVEKKRLGELEERVKSNRITPEERKQVEAELAGLKKKQTYNFTSKLLKTRQGRTRAYLYSKIRLSQIQNELVKKYEAEENPVEQNKLKQKIDLLSYALRNYGDTKNLANNRPDSETGDVTGVIGYHAMKTQILEKEDVEEIFVEPKDETFVQARDGINRTGNDSSAKDLASTEILTILHTLYKYDSKGKPVINKLGVNEITPFREVWNRLLRMLEGMTAPEMEKALLTQAEDYPPIKHLLAKLGPLETGSATENRLWTAFWRTFNLTKETLTQVTIDRVDGDYQVRIGDATGEVYKVGRDWESNFKSDHNNPYTKVNANGELYLDIPKVLRDFPANTLSDNRWAFFNAIGFSLSDKKEIKEAIANNNIGGAKYYRDRLENLLRRGDVEIKDFDDLNKAYPSKKVGDQRISALPDQATRYKDLLQLEQRYSDQYASTMVSTASGNSQSEYTLNSTMTQLINKLNNARDIKLEDGSTINAYQALISNKETAHFNLERNPILRGSTLFNSLFKLDVDPMSPEYGQRRKVSDKPDAPYVEINLTNLSGVLLQNEGITQGEGTDSSDTDPYTKLIKDLHLMVKSFQPELPRHGDKGTYHSAVPSKVFAGGKSKDMYVDTVDFLRQSYGHDQAVDILMGHIGAELDRIKVIERLNAEGIQNFDFNYLSRGKDFVAFDKMLSADTKKKLKGLEGTLQEYFDTGSQESLLLKRQISKEIQEFFDKQYESLSSRFNDAAFIADSLMDKIVGQGSNVRGTTVSESEAQEAMLRSLLYNTWINNIESMAVFYGDIAQYKVEKDEVHKRNSGIASTGLLSRTDKSMVDYINRAVNRDYAKKIGIEPKPFDGRFDTAVIQDKTTKSAYMEEYKEVLGEDGAKEYERMTEADAMGLISFDAYRILKTTQGQWLPEHEAMYQEIVNGKYVDPNKVKDIFFPTIKAQYFGPLQTQELSLTGFHKYELFPLIPTVIANSPKMQALHNKMVTENVDYVVFESGSKVSTITKNGTPDEYYNDKREVSEEPFTKNTIFLDYLKDQLEIAPKFKGKVTFPTQLRTLIEEGTFEDGVPVDFMGSASYKKRQEEWNKLTEAEKLETSPRYEAVKKFENYIDRVTEIKKRELLKRANWNIDDQGNLEGNVDDLVKFLKREMSRLDMSDHEIDFLAVHNGQLKHDLSMALFADKLERALQAIVTKELINQKVTGEGLIQVSGAMFESAASTTNRDYTNPTDEDLQKWGSNDLPTYHKGADGKTTAMKVKIALQGDFKKLLRLEHADGERIRTIERLNEMIKDEKWLNEGDHRRMITMVGVRIPVQGLNSMEFMEVYEFLPENAGNIIVPPAEIVAKAGSDYDIDKLTTIMPSFEINGEGVRLKKTYRKDSKEAKELYEQYKKAITEREKLKDSDGNKVDVRQLQDYRLNNEEDTYEKMQSVLDPYNKLIGDIFGVSLDDIDAEFESILLDEGVIKSYDDFIDELNGIKAAENDLLWSIKELLEQPFNYATLIRPNDTDLVKPTAMKYAKEVYGRDREAPKSGSDVLGYEFNLDKHHSNTAGKKTLGIGAVGNKWNPLFNRVGMRLNPSSGIAQEYYESLLAIPAKNRTREQKRDLRKYRRQKLFLPHHSITEDGRTSISLARSMDVDGKNKISDIINQMMNGWLDIAKDDWIFDIQGIEELTPSIEFMLEAGVPFETAIAMVSTPLVREYVKEQQLYNSSLATALGRRAKPNQIKLAAKKAIVTDPKYGFNIEGVSDRMLDYEIYQRTLKEVSEALGDDKVFDGEKLYKMSVAHKKAVDSGKTPTYGPYQKAAFLHFLEIEKMGTAMRDIKLRLNSDTKRTGTFFEIQNKIALKNELLNDERFPTQVIDRIINDSPISSFFIQEFQQEIYKDMFLIRDHESVRTFIQNHVTSADVSATFGKKEFYASEFRNDLMNFIFQNSIGSFNLDRIDSYRGLNVDTTIPVKEVKNLTYGAFVKDDVMYVDREAIIDQFELNELAEAEGLADVSYFAFETSREYARFVLEREYLRYSNPYSQIKDSIEYQRKYDQEIDSIDKLEEESIAEFEKRSNKIIYDRYLRDKALNNVNNMWKLFQSEDTYADEFRFIKEKYPELKENFAIINQLGISDTGSFANLKLNDSSLTGDLINLYHENLERLANPDVIKVDDSDANQYISDFFNRFATVAFLQSGQNTKSAFSMVRVVPQEQITMLMNEPVKEYKKHFDEAAEMGQVPPILQQFNSQFVANNSDRTTRIRGKNYSSELTLSKSKKMLLAGESLQHGEVMTSSGQPMSITESVFFDTIDRAVPQRQKEKSIEKQKEELKEKKEVPLQVVTDEMVRDYMNKCFGL